MDFFTLNEYKSSSQYILFFEGLIKQEKVTKDAFLSDLGISSSSFRRSKLEDSKIGQQIIKILAEHYKVNLVNEDDFNQMSRLVNDIYIDIFYKIYDRYDEYLEKTKELEKKNDLYFPIYKLLKVFLQYNSRFDVGKTIDYVKDDYEILKKYQNYFSEELKIIYDIVEVHHVDIDNLDVNSLKKNNPIAMAALALLTYLDKKYYKSLHYCKAVKEMFLKESNYKRVLYVDSTILNNLSFIGEFEEYYRLAKRDYYSAISFGFDKNLQYMFNTFTKHYAISTIALKKFDETILLLGNKESMTITEAYCLVIAKYYTSDNFNEWFMESLGNLSEKWSVLNDLINYLKNPTNQNFALIKHDQLMISIYNAINFIKE